jgi:hypothetical protein
MLLPPPPQVASLATRLTTAEPQVSSSLMMPGGGGGTDGGGEGTIEQVTENRTGTHGTGTNNDTTSLPSNYFPVALSSTYPGSAGQAPVSAEDLDPAPPISGQNAPGAAAGLEQPPLEAGTNEVNHQFETTEGVGHIDLSEGWLETTLDGDMYLPTGSSLTDSNRWWQTEVTITVGTDGVQSTQITPIKSILLTEVNWATRQPARPRPGARKLSTWTLSVQSTGPVVGQRWQIDFSVPLHFENRLDACPRRSDRGS